MSGSSAPCNLSPSPHKTKPGILGQVYAQLRTVPVSWSHIIQSYIAARSRLLALNEQNVHFHRHEIWKQPMLLTTHRHSSSRGWAVGYCERVGWMISLKCRLKTQLITPRPEITEPSESGWVPTFLLTREKTLQIPPLKKSGSHRHCSWKSAMEKGLQMLSSKNDYMLSH